MEFFAQFSLVEQFIFLYFIIISIITFFYFGIDKLRSRFQKQRVSEKKLWFLVAIGGGLGALFGMHFFRHKTQKMSFQAVIAVILSAQVIFGVYLFLL